MSIIISIDGNIGSGKSTFLKELEKNANSLCLGEYSNEYEFVFLQEPVDQWVDIKNEDNKSILSLFYENQKKYSFAFQMIAYISRLDKLKSVLEGEKKKIILTERSVHTDKYVFAQMLYDDKLMENVEYQIYNKWFHSFIDKVPLCGVIYVDVDPKICQSRIQKRARDGETIPIQYLERCEDYHKKYIQNYNCLKIDGNKDFEHMKQNAFSQTNSFIYNVISSLPK